MTQKTLEDAPEAVVRSGDYTFGRFGTPFGRANLLDVDKPFLYPLPRFMKNWRLKEWRAFQFGDERWFFFCAQYSAKILGLGLVLFHAYDRAAKKQYSLKKTLVGRSFPFGERISESKTAYKSSHDFLTMDCEYERGFIELHVAKKQRSRGSSGFSGSFRFDCRPRFAAPESVCLPLGLNRAMYSTKILMPMEGSFIVNGESLDFSAPSAMGVFDDHKGYYPYQLRYDWVCGFGLDQKKRRAGFNLTDNQVRDQLRYNENCMWLNGRIWPLPPIKITRPQGVAGEWIIQDTEGLVDLVFIPETHNSLRFNLGVLASDYNSPFGTFRGIVKNGAGDKIQAELLFGAGEQKYLRA